MTTISAVNHQGKRVIGIGADVREAGRAVIASSTETGFEHCECCDLAAAVSTLAFLALIGALPQEAMTESEFWRASVVTK